MMNLSASFSNLSLKAKIATLTAFLLLITASLGVYAVRSMSLINTELVAIAEQDIPLTSIVVETTVNQLEQAIWFERGLRFGEEMAEHPTKKADFERAVAGFKEHSEHVDHALQRGKQLAAAAVDTAPGPQELAEFQHVVAALGTIEQEHQAYEQHVGEIFGLLGRGQFAEALRLAASVEAEEEQLDHELEALVAEIEHFTGQAAKNAEAHEQHAQRVTVIMLGVTLLVGGLVSWWVGRDVSRRIAYAVSVANTVASGDLRQREENSSHSDEVGQLLAALGVMRVNLGHLISQIQDASNGLAVSTEELSTASSQVTGNVSRQQQELEQVATAFNEMNATIQEVSHSATATAEATRNATHTSEQGKEIIADAVTASQGLAGSIQGVAAVIEQLGQDSEAIGTVIDVIKSIAEQTNLLALNAAIEAARAGEQGRGFAVVADEVRTLAQRTQESTQEIESMIDRLQTTSRNAVQTMEGSRTQAQMTVGKANDAGESFAAISTAIGTISDMSVQIASAAEEQTMVSEDINRNLTVISQGAEENAAAMTQTNGASEELARMADGLQAATKQFRVA